jgi:hypothetical protein
MVDALPGRTSNMLITIIIKKRFSHIRIMYSRNFEQNNIPKADNTTGMRRDKAEEKIFRLVLLLRNRSDPDRPLKSRAASRNIVCFFSHDNPHSSASQMSDLGEP